MLFKLKNIGKLAEAEIKLDGITVICGDNNTGKSTVGKALYSFYKSLHNYKEKIIESKINSIELYFENELQNPLWIHGNEPSRLLYSFIKKNNNRVKSTDVSYFFANAINIKLSKAEVDTITKILNTSDEEILNEYVFRHFDSIFNGQVKNIKNFRNKSTIKAEFKGGSKIDTLDFYKEKCNCTQNDPIIHKAFYINNPFVIDHLNEFFAYLSPDNIETNVVAAIRDAQKSIENDKMTNIINVVANKKELDILKKQLKSTYTGDTVIKDGKLYYNENGTDIDIRNISTGLKAFALIERMLTLGILNKQDVLVLDEPEIHLHSEWQIKYAELIVMLQKHFDLTILIVTHSFQFLEALNFFMKEKGIEKCGSFYTPELTDKGVIIKEVDDSYGKLLRNLSKGTFTMADLEYEYEMKHETIKLENDHGYSE